MSQTYLVTPATDEPVTLDELKAHVNVDAGTTSEDGVLTSYGIAARELVEEATGVNLMPATYKHEFFPVYPSDAEMNAYGSYGIVRAFAYLQRAPVQSITSVQYYDATGGLNTLDPSLYRLQDNRLIITQMDAVAIREDAVTVTFIAGFSDADSVPSLAKQLVKMIAADWYRSREASITGTIIADVPSYQLLFRAVRSYCKR